MPLKHLFVGALWCLCMVEEPGNGIELVAYHPLCPFSITQRSPIIGIGGGIDGVVDTI